MTTEAEAQLDQDLASYLDLAGCDLLSIAGRVEALATESKDQLAGHKLRAWAKYLRRTGESQRALGRQLSDVGNRILLAPLEQDMRNTVMTMPAGIAMTSPGGRLHRSGWPSTNKVDGQDEQHLLDEEQPLPPPPWGAGAYPHSRFPVRDPNFGVRRFLD